VDPDAVPLVAAWARAFLATLLLEGLVAGALLRRAEPLLSRRLGVIAFAQLASHPAVWFVFPALGIDDHVAFALSELWAVLVEAVFYGLVFRGITPLRAFGVALVANGFSLTVGLLLYRVGWL
jgi:hypothetical protein